MFELAPNKILMGINALCSYRTFPNTLIENKMQKCCDAMFTPLAPVFFTSISLSCPKASLPANYPHPLIIQLHFFSALSLLALFIPTSSPLSHT
jgi:hypothetical protein